MKDVMNVRAKPFKKKVWCVVVTPESKRQCELIQETIHRYWNVESDIRRLPPKRRKS